MRTIIYQALINNAAVRDAVGDRIYQSGSLGVGNIPADPQRPYLVIKESAMVPYDSVRRTSRANKKTWQIFCYDERGDYDRIGSILAAVRETILGVTLGVDNATGTRCDDVRWAGESGDMVDQQADTNVKYSIFQTTSNQ